MGLAGIASGQFRQLRLALASVPQVGHPRVGEAGLDALADPEVVLGRGGHQGLVGDAEHLALLRQAPQQLGHGAADAAAHTRIDLIEEQRDVGVGRGQAGFQRQQEAAHLAAGGHLGQGSRGLARVGGEQELHRIGPLLAGLGGAQGDGETHVGQSHRPQGRHQLVLEVAGGGGAGTGEHGIGPITPLAGGGFGGLQARQGRLGIRPGQLLAQLVAPGDQFGQALAVAALQGLELGHALLQQGQALRVALQQRAVAIQIPGQVLQPGQGVSAGPVQDHHAGVEGGHGLQLLVAGRQVIQHRRGGLGPFHQSADQGHHALLQPHRMGQPVLLPLEPLAFSGILERRGLQLRQQVLLAVPLQGEALPVSAGPRQGCGLPLPLQPGGAGGFEGLGQALTGEAIQPAALLAGAAQLLGLALDGEIEQQRPQLQHLAAAHHHAIEPVAAGEPALLEPPVPTQQQLALLGLQLLALQPVANRGREAEAGLDAAPLGAAPQQAGPLAALGTAEQGIEGIEQDRLTGAGLAGEHGEPGRKQQLQPLDQGDVLEAQTREHPGLRRAIGTWPDRSGCDFRLEGGFACRRHGGASPPWFPPPQPPPRPPSA